jgi:hypothetical protein
MMEQLAEQIASALEGKGWCVVDDALPDSVAVALARECSDERTAGFKLAGVGRRNDYQHDAAVRSDAICWIDPSLEAGARSGCFSGSSTMNVTTPGMRLARSIASTSMRLSVKRTGCYRQSSI